MTFDDFVKSWLGKGIDWDGRYSFQCMDVYRQYVHDVLNYPQSPGVQGAADVWDTYLSDYFERISLGAGNIPLRGDIAIWKKAASNGHFGHIAIVEAATAQSLTILEQDGLKNTVLRRRTTNYTGVLGWLRPKTTMSNTIAVPKSDFETLVTKSSKYDEFVKRGITPEYIEELKRDKDAADNTAKERREEFDRYIEKLASLLSVVSDKDMVREGVEKLLAVEESKRKLERQLHDEEIKHDVEVNTLKEEISKLRGEVEHGQQEYSKMLQRLKELEEKTVQAEAKRQFLDGLWGIISNLLRKKK